MSDNASESEQHFICADVWLEVFAFLCPFDVGLKIALLSDRFDALVDEHFKLKKWSMGWLQIRRANDGNGAEIVKSLFPKSFGFGEPLPIPQVPLPNKVTGFAEIKISYVDQTVIEFLQRIRRLFDSSGTNVVIDTSDEQSRSWEIICQKIWPFVNDNICRFLLVDSSQLGRFRQFSPTVLLNCANLRSVRVFGPFPGFPAEDNADASSDQAVAKWLRTPRRDGLPKMFHFHASSTGMEGLKQSFVNASEPVNFIICLSPAYPADTEPFELENNLTGERLTFRRLTENYWLLVRCPIGRKEAKWAAWEKEAIEWEWSCGWYSSPQWNFITIDFSDRDIGDGMVDEKAGPSEPKK